MKYFSIKHALALIFLLVFAVPAMAIVWCHDYTMWRVTGQDVNSISVTQLRQKLTELHFKRFPFTNAARLPQAQSRLRPGDVVIIGDAHSGVVNERGLIDHFVQKFGASGTRYQPGEVEQLESSHRDWTLVEILDFSRTAPEGQQVFPYRDKEVEVWRKVNSQ